MRSSDMIAAKRLVFLVGAPRSGTTWLQLMLARSQGVATVNETHLFSTYMRSLFDGDPALRRDQRGIGLSAIFGESEYLDLLRDFASATLAHILATKPDASVILEKTPTHVMYWRDILRIYPHAYFLHLVRDPRAVVASLADAHKSWGRAWTTSRIGDLSAMWINSVNQAQAIRSATPNYLQLRYEDLAQSGVETLQTAFTWIGIGTSEEACREILHDTAIDKLRSGEVNGTPWSLAAEPKGFYRKGVVDSWRQELSAKQIFLVETITRDLMAEFGYRTEATPSALHRAVYCGQHAVATRVRAGIEWRMRRMADRLSSQARVAS